MLGYPTTLGRVPPRASQPPEAEVPVDQVDPFDWNGRLTLDMIRVHTKTDDVPGVTDEQLKLYREAAVEAAELYTGALLIGQKMVTEPVEIPISRNNGNKPFYRVRLKYPVADGLVFLYGHGARHPVHIAPGTRSVRIPVMTGFLDMSNCCDPCSVGMQNGGMMALYKAGFASIDHVPSGIVLGILQFIAWVIEHPGDELLTQRNRLDARGGAGVYGTNNIAMASGAVETWRLYDAEAI